MINLKSPHAELEKQDTHFLSALGWLTSLAYTVIVFGSDLFG